MDNRWETTTCRELCQMVRYIARRSFRIPMQQELVAKYLDTYYQQFYQQCKLAIDSIN